MKKLMIGLLLAVTACSEAVTTTSSVAEDTSTTSPSSSTFTTEPTSPETSLLTAQSIEITIPAPGLDLVGTLRLPAGEASAPAVVLIHGSGPQRRDSRLAGQLNMGFGFEIPVFGELAEALQESGWAVLTYDKRSCGPFNGCADNGYPLPDEDLTIETFIDDARAGVDFLRQRPEVDPARISIIGHSQGAQFITLMLEADPGLVSGVMMAGPYRPIDEITQTQLDSTIDLLGRLGMSEEEALALPTVTPLVDMVDGLADIRSGSSEPVAGVSAEFWQSWFDLHEQSLSAAFRIAQPLLVLNGDYDWNIPASEAQAWGEYLGGVDADFELVILPCVTHALNCVSEPDPAAITPMDIGPAVSPEVIDTLIAFLTG
jgi:pimeloyl-ACP methyl ester carboxylesterase